MNGRDPGEPAETITCADSTCTASYEQRPGEGLAYAHMRAFDDGWTHTGSGWGYRDWCPDHTQPGAKPETLKDWMSHAGRDPLFATDTVSAPSLTYANIVAFYETIRTQQHAPYVDPFPNPQPLPRDDGSAYSMFKMAGASWRYQAEIERRCEEITADIRCLMDAAVQRVVVRALHDEALGDLDNWQPTGIIQ